MSYPRLAFANQIPKKIMDSELVNDLKLDLVLTPEVTSFMLLSPDKETLTARQETFKALLCDLDSEQKLTTLCSSLENAEELYKALATAQSEKTAALIFVRLLIKIAEFCSLAAKTDSYGVLFSRFAAEMKRVSESPEFSQAIKTASELDISITQAQSITLKTDIETMSAQKTEGSGIAASLRACANELGIEINERPIAPITLQKGISEALGTIHPEITAKAISFLSSCRTLITGELFEYLPELKFFKNALAFTKFAIDNGLPYSFPKISEDKTVDLQDVYDITLLKKGGKIVPNDVFFDEKEPFFYLTGANGGGKTTYIRAVGGGILCFLAGMPVFCTGGRAPLLSAVYAHFPRDERFEGTGRFLDEKKRVDAILKKQDGNALILLNETFATTGEEKAIEQTGILADTLHASGNLGLYITHQHGVSKTEIPFLGVTVDEQNSNRRTYKIEKRRLPPKSFARDILEKYRLDKESLKNRFKG